MRLQINTAGAWRNVVDYTSRHDNEVRFHAVGLARVLDAKLRVLDDQGRTLTWWSKDRGWHNPLQDTA